MKSECEEVRGEIKVVVSLNSAHYQLIPDRSKSSPINAHQQLVLCS